MAKANAYRRADQKIEEARRSGAKELDLSTEWNVPGEDVLTELPQSLGQLTRLQSLILSGNRLMDVSVNNVYRS